MAFTLLFCAWQHPDWPVWMALLTSTAGPFPNSMPIVTNAANITTTRQIARRKLDDEADFVVVDSNIAFRQTFETVELVETYVRAPREIVEATRKILTAERFDSVAKTVRDLIFYSVGCNRIPLFTNVRGGRGRTLFEFQCVFDGCPAFLDVRLFSGVDIVKWVVMGISHSHPFDVFPPRMPRNTFPDDILEKIRGMGAEKVQVAEIKLKRRMDYVHLASWHFTWLFMNTRPEVATINGAPMGFPFVAQTRHHQL